MNLKEAFRYQSFIMQTFASAANILTSPSHMMKVTENHMISKANAEAADEIRERPRPENDVDPNKIIRLMDSLIVERETLTKAIADAKSGTKENLDTLLETNKMRQTYAAHLRKVCNMPTKETETQSTGRKFNNEGNQITFVYPVTVTPELLVDKTSIKEKANKLRQDADNTSNAIDSIMVNTIVDYTPPYDVNMSLEEVLESMP